MMTPEAQTFLNEWRNSANFVSAHTSGSTGAPKLIKLLKRDMEVSAQATNSFFGITSSSHLLLPLSPDYIAGKMMIVRAEIAGCHLTVETPSNSPFKSDYGNIDLMAVVPSQCEALIENPIALHRIRHLIIGGAALSPSLEAALMHTPWKVYATYGMTETCSHVALRRLGESRYTALPGITFSTDSRGCLVIHAPAYSFQQLITNDIVRLLNATEFEWLGRFDNVINSGGIKLYPEQLEQILLTHVDRPLLVRKTHHPRWGETPEVVVELSPSDSAESLEAFINNICNEHLPKEARHAVIKTVAILPRTPNGKLRRTP